MLDTLSTKTKNCLKHHNILNIQQLRDTDKLTLLNIRGLGVKGLTEIQHLLKRRNLKGSIGSLNYLTNRALENPKDVVKILSKNPTQALKVIQNIKKYLGDTQALDFAVIYIKSIQN